MPSPWWDAGDTPVRAASPMAGSDGSAASIQRIPRADGGIAPAAGRVASTGYATAQAPAGASHQSIVQRSAAAAGRSSQSMAPLPAPIGPAGRAGSGAASSHSGSSSSTQAADAPSVQTSLVRSSAPLAGGFGSLGSNPVIQREGGNVAMKAETPPAAPAGPAGPGGSGPVPPAGPASSGHSEKDLDELAQALFGRIRGRLRSDLIYDREAKGLTFDNV
jgi:hypothetical protein